MPKILCFAGSARKQSWNRQLLEVAARMIREQGGETTMLELGELGLPLFDEDLEREQGTPDGAKRLKQAMFAHDGFVIACPEYNSSITPLLKNTIDWASRPAQGETPLQAFKGKVCGLISASQGALGGLRGLVHVRSILGNIGVVVLPEQSAVGAIHDQLVNGDLKDGPPKKFLGEMTQRIVEVTRRLHA